MSDGNGSHVSRAELRAHLGPMRDDIAEIRQDVKRLLDRDVAARAREQADSARWARRRTMFGWHYSAVAGLLAALLGGVTGSLAGHLF